MIFKWDKFQKFDDGSQSTKCRFKMYKGDTIAKENMIHAGWITDHTVQKQKEKDNAQREYVAYAYSIHCVGLADATLFEVFREHGFSTKDFGYNYNNCCGICPNEQVRDVFGPYAYAGTPKCSVYEVIDMVEEAVCRQHYFDYDKELACLNERQTLMNECKEYLKEKELTREGYTQDAIEANNQEYLDAVDIEIEE